MVALNSESSKTNPASDQDGISRYFHGTFTATRRLGVNRKYGAGSVGIETQKFDIELIDKSQITTERLETNISNVISSSVALTTG